MESRFFTRIDRVLRRSLGVSETAPTDETVKPAPPVDPELPSDEELDDLTGSTINFADFKDQQDDAGPQVVIPDDLKGKV